MTLSKQSSNIAYINLITFYEASEPFNPCILNYRNYSYFFSYKDG
jgi:hypothetical protein